MQMIDGSFQKMSSQGKGIDGNWWCAGLLRKQEEQDSEGAMVAPLLQQVAAEVQHFVATSGFLRMPTRLELKVAGTTPHSSPVQSPRCVKATLSLTGKKRVQTA